MIFGTLRLRDLAVKHSLTTSLVKGAGFGPSWVRCPGDRVKFPVFPFILLVDIHRTRRR